MSQNTLKTSGIRKFYRPGQLVTIDKHVYRIRKSKIEESACCLCSLQQFREKCANIACLHHLPVDCYLQFVK